MDMGYGPSLGAAVLLCLPLWGCGGDTGGESSGTGGAPASDAGNAEDDGPPEQDSAADSMPDASPPIVCECPEDFPNTAPTPGSACNCVNEFVCSKLVCPAGESHSLQCLSGKWQHMVAWDYYCPPDAG